MANAVNLKRREQITFVAQNLFRERGYVATSIRDLANEVGIEPASLYSHIKSKEAILQEICFRIADEFFNAIEKIEKANYPPDEKLKQAITIHISVIKKNADAAAVFLHEWRHLSEPYLSEFKLLRKKYDNIFKEIIRVGIKQNLFKNLDVKVTVLTIFSALNWSYNWYKTPNKISPKEISNHLSNLILNGLKK